ncbi:MAG: hypothetical protein E7774_05795 [Bradyrhizobium sp.]|nr:MAG: hypothetical protein E7774_05795 [Bradyrhizobium sp.]
MARLVSPLIAAFALCALASLSPQTALAQAQAPAQSTDAPEEPLKQIALTDAIVQAYITAEAEVDPLLAKLPQNDDAAVDPKLVATLDAAVKKHNFASFDDFQDVGANIGQVMDGIDPATKKYVGADVLLKRQIAALQADTKMAAADKKQELAELSEALKAAEPLKNPGNADVVLKYYDQLDDSEPKQK